MTFYVVLLFASLFIALVIVFWQLILRPSFVAYYKAEMEGVVNGLLQKTISGELDWNSETFQHNYRTLCILRDHGHEVTSLNYFFMGLYEKKYNLDTTQYETLFETGDTAVEREIYGKARGKFLVATSRYLRHTTILLSPLLLLAKFLIRWISKLENKVDDVESIESSAKRLRKTAWMRRFALSRDNMLKEASKLVDKYELKSAKC